MMSLLVATEHVKMKGGDRTLAEQTNDLQYVISTRWHPGNNALHPPHGFGFDGPGESGMPGLEQLKG